MTLQSQDVKNTKHENNTESCNEKMPTLLQIKHNSITPNHHPSSQECTEQWALVSEITADQEYHTKLFFKSSSKLKTFLENHVITQFMTKKAALQ